MVTTTGLGLAISSTTAMVGGTLPARGLVLSAMDAKAKTILINNQHLKLHAIGLRSSSCTPRVTRVTRECNG